MAPHRHRPPPPPPNVLRLPFLGKILGGVEIWEEAMLRVPASTCLPFCGASFRIVRAGLIAALEDPIFLAMLLLECKVSVEIFDAGGSRPGEVIAKQSRTTSPGSEGQARRK